MITIYFYDVDFHLQKQDVETIFKREKESFIVGVVHNAQRVVFHHETLSQLEKMAIASPFFDTNNIERNDFALPREIDFTGIVLTPLFGGSAPQIDACCPETNQHLAQIKEYSRLSELHQGITQLNSVQTVALLQALGNQTLSINQDLNARFDELKIINMQIRDQNSAPSAPTNDLTINEISVDGVNNWEVNLSASSPAKNEGYLYTYLLEIFNSGVLLESRIVIFEIRKNETLSSVVYNYMNYEFDSYTLTYIKSDLNNCNPPQIEFDYQLFDGANPFMQVTARPLLSAPDSRGYYYYITANEVNSSGVVQRQTWFYFNFYEGQTIPTAGNYQNVGLLNSTNTLEIVSIESSCQINEG